MIGDKPLSKTLLDCCRLHHHGQTSVKFLSEIQFPLSCWRGPSWIDLDDWTNICLLSGSREDGYTIKPNVSFLAAGEYKYMGMWLGIHLLQGGELTQIFTPSFVDFLLDENEADSVEDVKDQRIRSDLEKLLDTSEEDFNGRFSACLDWVSQVNGASTYTTYSNREEWAHSMAAVLAKVNIMPYVLQFKEGLRINGVLKWLQKHNARVLLQFHTITATADGVASLLKPSVKTADERIVWENFKTFLHLCESVELEGLLRQENCPVPMVEFGKTCTPGHVLGFITGAATRPACGFETRPRLGFTYTRVQRSLPEAQTCAGRLNINVSGRALHMGSFAVDFCEALMNKGMNHL